VDVFTHALLGATTVHALAPRQDPLPSRHRLLLGGARGGVPGCGLRRVPLRSARFLADWHQGPTHSIVLLPVWAALIAALYVAIAGSRGRLFGAAFVASAIALATHVLSDLITVYGTALFYPLSDLRFSLGTTFVIDPVVTAILLAALGFSIVMERRSLARAGLLVLVSYVAGQAHLSSVPGVRARVGRTVRAVRRAHVRAPAAIFSVQLETHRHRRRHVPRELRERGGAQAPGAGTFPSRRWRARTDRPVSWHGDRATDVR
jgi:membrane-bound metal-dependent hydrolase YbcI (DUF457 family)